MAVEGPEFERAFRGAIQYALNSGFSEILELRPYFTSSSVRMSLRSCQLDAANLWYFSLCRKFVRIFTAKIATDLACTQRRYPCNTSGFSRQCYSGPQGSHLPIYANPLWFSVSFAKLHPSGPALNFLPLPPPLRRRMHLSSISVLRPSASAKSRFP